MCHYGATRIHSRQSAGDNLAEIMMVQLDYVEELIPALVEYDSKDSTLLDKKGHLEFRGTVESLFCAADMTRPDI